MPQPIAGVVPPEIDEAPATTVWPTIGATRAGRWVGRLAALPYGAGPLTLGALLLAVLTVPVSLAAFAWQLMPFVCVRYLLTNRRLIVCRGLRAVDEKWIGLDEFDAVDVEILPGQQWLRCGEVVFRREGREVLRFSGVSRPQVFRQVCLKARNSLVSVREVLERQAAAEA